jgi:hypothetical protein
MKTRDEDNCYSKHIGLSVGGRASGVGSAGNGNAGSAASVPTDGGGHGKVPNGKVSNGAGQGKVSSFHWKGLKSQKTPFHTRCHWFLFLALQQMLTC